MEPNYVDDDAIGCRGTIVVATRGADGPGEVMLNIRGSREAYIAWSGTALGIGTQVIAIDLRSGRTVDVVPWTERF